MRYSLTPVANIRLTPNEGKDVEQLTLIYSEGELSKAITLEEHLVVSHEPEFHFTIFSGKNTPWGFHKGGEGIDFHKSLKTDVHSSFLSNCKNLEATKMCSAGEIMCKLFYTQIKE